MSRRPVGSPSTACSRTSWICFCAHICSGFGESSEYSGTSKVFDSEGIGQNEPSERTFLFRNSMSDLLIPILVIQVPSERTFLFRNSMSDLLIPILVIQVENLQVPRKLFKCL